MGKRQRKHARENSKNFLVRLKETAAYLGGKRKDKRGRGAAGKGMALGILERNGKVFTTALETAKTSGILKTIKNKAEKRSIFYSDTFKSDKSLSLIGRPVALDHTKEFVNGRVHMNGLEGFWSFAKERMLKYHGISKVNFHIYLKEFGIPVQPLEPEFHRTFHYVALKST